MKEGEGEDDDEEEGGKGYLVNCGWMKDSQLVMMPPVTLARSHISRVPTLGDISGEGGGMMR